MPSQAPTAAAAASASAGERTGLTPPSRRRKGHRIGDIIVELGFAKAAVVLAAVDMARRTGAMTGQVLLAEGVISADQLARAIAERYEVEHVDLSVFKPDMAAANLLDVGAAKRYEAVPIAFWDERTLLVAMSDPANVIAVDEIAMTTGYAVRRAAAAPADIEAVVARLDRLDREAALTVSEPEPDPEPIADLRESADDAPVVRLVHGIVAQAIERRASDIHWDPTGGDMHVRARVDGVMWDMTTVPRGLVPKVVSRIKIMAELDIAERRMPQDGRLGLVIDGRQVDIRLVTLPTVDGESVVMRILDEDERLLTLDDLGLAAREREPMDAVIRRANGAVLVTGPTGSGKSTTLYAALAEISSPEKTIITIEDPVERRMPGIKQVQVNRRTGLTFATGLRSMMRADPDVVMIGEIRDRETAQIAIESSLTGHLVFSTLHTNDAPTAITRLIEMDIEPFLVASSIAAVMAQRLARALCESCKRPVTLTEQVLRDAGFAVDGPVEGCQPVGCMRCGDTGFRGRVGLFELMTMTEELRDLVLSRAPADAIARTARAQGMRRLADDGLEKIAAGRTSLAEVLRVATVS